MDIKLITDRLLRDMNDGFLVLDLHGKVLFVNDMGQKMLGFASDIVDRSFGEIFIENDTDGKNDGFVQFVLDAVYDKHNTHKGNAEYTSPDGKTLSFYITSSFMRGKSDEITGVIIVFSDITKTERLIRQRNDSSVCFAVFMTCIGCYLFLIKFLEYINKMPPGWIMNLVIEVISIIMFFIIIKFTSFSLKDIGLKITNAKATFIPTAIVVALGLVLLIGVKAIMLNMSIDFFPKGAPFWDFSIINASVLYYPFTAVLQEFLTRSVMQENLRRIFSGKHKLALSIIVSALIFGVLHIAYGLPYMLASAALLGATGILYFKQGNIWGLSIIHYVLGLAAMFLRYVE